MDIFLKGKVHQTKCDLSRVAQQCGTQLIGNRLIRAANQMHCHNAYSCMKHCLGLTQVLMWRDIGEGHLYALALSQSCTV